MSYRLENDEIPAAGLRRIADEPAEKVLHQRRDCPEGDNEAIQDAHKRFKKIRALLLRLVSDEIGGEGCQRQNQCLPRCWAAHGCALR